MTSEEIGRSFTLLRADGALDLPLKAAAGPRSGSARVLTDPEADISACVKFRPVSKV